MFSICLFAFTSFFPTILNLRSHGQHINPAAAIWIAFAICFKFSPSRRRTQLLSFPYSYYSCIKYSTTTFDVAFLLYSMGKKESSWCSAADVPPLARVAAFLFRPGNSHGQHNNPAAAIWIAFAICFFSPSRRRTQLLSFPYSYYSCI